MFEQVLGAEHAFLEGSHAITGARSCDNQRRHQRQAQNECGYRKNRAERHLARYLIPNGCALDYGEPAAVGSRPQ
jgi:hypothetical protein